LAEKLAVEALPADARFHVFSEGASGIFIVGREDADLMQGVTWLLSELGREVMHSDSEISVTHLSKLG
jgi:hypothetical protein